MMMRMRTGLARPAFILRRAFAYSTTDVDIQEFHEELKSVFGSELEGPPLNGFDESSFGSMGNSLTHVDSAGKASMVDISSKADTKRIAVASGKVVLGEKVFDLVAANKVSKGDVLTVAKIAGIQAAKQTPNLIPLCHVIPLTSVDMDLALDKETYSVKMRAEVKSVGGSGVEMEALTAVSVACLSVYDMCKAVSKDMKICDVQLETKSGGKSGIWQRSID